MRDVIVITMPEIFPGETEVVNTLFANGMQRLHLRKPGASEEEMAEWIVSRDDWDFATAEMGINLVDVMEADEFYKRASAFLDVLAKDKRTVYCTDMFTAGSDITNPEKMQKFRAIIRELTEGRFPYICGTELMTSTAGLSADFVHPNIRGVNEITQNLTKFIKDWSK